MDPREWAAKYAIEVTTDDLLRSLAIPCPDCKAPVGAVCVPLREEPKMLENLKMGPGDWTHMLRIRGSRGPT